MHIALWAIFAFAVLKAIFGVMGWYSRNGSDEIYRKRLDAVWDRLHEGTFFDYFQRVQQRLVTRIENTFWYPHPKLWLLVKWSLVISIIAILFGAELFEVVVAKWPEHVYSLELELRPDHEYSFGRGMLITFLPGWAPMGHFEPILTTVLLLLSGVIFQLFSFWISWRMLKGASQSQTLGAVVLRLGINAVVIIMSMLFVNAIHAGTLQLVEKWLAPSDYVTRNISFSEFFWFNAVSFVDIVFGWTVGLRPYELTLYEVRGVCFAMSLVLPTFAYVAICVFSLVARFTPKVLQRIVTHSIFLISTDEQPVFTQMGSIVGVIAAIIAALISAIKGP